MADLIDRATLLEKRVPKEKTSDLVCQMIPLKDVLEAPTIDAKPVVHGEIIEIIEKGKMKRVFSCCNAVCTQLTMWIEPAFCPYCGAKMDGGKET